MSYLLNHGRKKLVVTAALFVSFLFLTPVAHCDNLKKAMLVVLPFNDFQAESLDMQIPLIISGELSGHENITVVPFEVIKERLYEIEPSYMWTEKEGGVKGGGIFWNIRPMTVMKVREDTQADYTVYGDVWRYDGSWNIDCHVESGDYSAATRSWSFAGKGEESLLKKLREVAGSIAGWISNEIALKEAEEDIRKFMGGVYSHGYAIDKMRKRLTEFPDSVPVRALLLDLLRKDENKYQDEIVIEGRKIIDILDPSRESDIRYLLSLSLDPFDLIARIFESKEEWTKAIGVRLKALKLFRVKTSLHEKVLGRDHYYYATYLEANSRNTEALQHYMKAVEILSPSSEYYKKAKQGVLKLKN